MHDGLDGSHRLIILTPEDQSKYFSTKPYWLIELYQKGKVIIVPSYLENCKLADLTPFFDPL